MKLRVNLFRSGRTEILVEAEGWSGKLFLDNIMTTRPSSGTYSFTEAEGALIHEAFAKLQYGVKEVLEAANRRIMGEESI